MMKFHQADEKTRQRITAKTETAKAKGIKQSEADENEKNQNYIITALTDKLCETRLYKFARSVNKTYYQHIVKHYSVFPPITNATIYPEEEEAMYIEFRESFPICHAVFSFIEPTLSFQVDLATSSNGSKPNPDMDVDTPAAMDNEDAGEEEEATINNNSRKKSIIHKNEKTWGLLPA